MADLPRRIAGKAHIVGSLPELEDQLATWEPMSGQPSPDRLDAMVWGLTELAIIGGSEVFESPEHDVLCPPKEAIPSIWQRVSVVDVWHDGMAALFGAYDRSADTLYLTHEVVLPRGEPAIIGQALRRRGSWIPCVMELEGRGRSVQEGAALASQIGEAGVEISGVKVDQGAALASVATRITSKTLLVYDTLASWRSEYRGYRKDEDGKLPKSHDNLMRLTGVMVACGLDVAITERVAESNRRGMSGALVPRSGRRSSTGYN